MESVYQSQGYENIHSYGNTASQTAGWGNQAASIYPTGTIGAMYWSTKSCSRKWEEPQLTQPFSWTTRQILNLILHIESFNSNSTEKKLKDIFGEKSKINRMTISYVKQNDQAVYFWKNRDTVSLALICIWKRGNRADPERHCWYTSSGFETVLQVKYYLTSKYNLITTCNKTS